MANKSSLVITATDAVTGKAQQKTVTDINPQASSTHLKTWAQMTASLTRDGYIKSKRVDVRELDDQANSQRTFTTMRYSINNGSSYVDIPQDGIINASPSDFVAAPGYYRIYFLLKGKDAFCLPTLELSSSIGTKLFPHNAIYDYPNARWTRDNWLISFTTEDLNQLLPQVITAKVTFPASGDYDAWSKIITFNVSEPT